MCEVLKIYVHPVHSNYFVITEETEDLDIDDINGVTTVPMLFKETNGQIYHLTPEVYKFDYKQHPVTNS